MPLSAHYDRKKLTILLAASLGFMALSLVLAQTDDPYIFATAQVTFLFFVGLTVFVLARFLEKREILHIDENGVFDRRIVDTTIPWSEVERLREVGKGKMRFISVTTTRATTDYITSGLKRKMMKLNEFIGFHAIGINANSIDVSFDEMRAAFAAFGPEIEKPGAKTDEENSEEAAQ
ncbi:STM3941 family protein [Breoghania sp.]|uniref:STM3941 family protein n=1 Tax=Breoghania sp. TaxID=2065378 RepID=UPI002AAC0A8C|nr:STM3941 family protein [Breoghania sp.]